MSRLSVCLAAALVAVGLTSVSSAMGQSHGAHVHGIGSLAIALEGTRVDLELELSGADTVGFEHAPSTQRETEAVEAAVKTLNSPDQLFRFPKQAGCTGRVMSLESDLLKHDHGHAEHAEFHVRYQFTCARPDAIAYLDVGLFEAFPATRELDVTAITPTGQRAGELTAAKTRFAF